MVLEIVSTSTQIISPLLRTTSYPINNLRQKIPRSNSLKSFEKHLQTRCSSKPISQIHTLRRAVSADFNGSLRPNMLGIMPDPPVWPEREQVLQEVMKETVARRANCMDFPFSLRMIKKKENNSNYHSKPVNPESPCSVNNAFSAMAAIVIGIQNHALQSREAENSSEDHQVMINRVQTEMRGSFACIFQQVFSRTPSLMTDVMILLSDFCVHSILEEMMITTEQNRYKEMGNGFLAGKEIRHDIAELKTIFPSRLTPNDEEDAVNSDDEEIELWKSMVEEAGFMSNYHAEMISSSRVEIEQDNYREFSMTDLTYQMNLFEDPHNPLILCNYAQFLQLVTHDYDRAEECYKRSIQLEPADASTLNQYANFLWIVRNDLWAAEEQYQEAIAVEPENTYYVSAYAHFLWNTGGEDTCFLSDKP